MSRNLGTYNIQYLGTSLTKRIRSSPLPTIAMETIKLSHLNDCPEGPAPQTFTRESRLLYQELRDRGYALLDASTATGSRNVPPILSGVFGPAKRFFATGDGNKGDQARSDGVLAGYFPAAAGRPEHFIVRPADSDGSGAADAPVFVAKAALALGKAVSDGRALLNALGWAVNSQEGEQFARLLDQRPLPSGERSSSLLKVLNYGGGNGGGASLLEEHVDRGLLTMVVQQRGGLEVFDQRDEDWKEMPADACVLLVGYTLEAASGGAFKAVKHRVRPSSSSSSSESRLSLAFQIRARRDASVSISGVPPGLRRSTNATAGNQSPTTVATVLSRFAATHSSVTGHDRDEDARDQQQQQAKRPRVSSAGGANQASSHEERSSPSDGGPVLTIRIRDQYGEETYFKVKPQTRMDKVFNAFATRKGFPRNSLKFMIDAQRISDLDTPQSLELEDYDQIDVMPELRGD